jgi:hypothetical protein
MAIKTREAGVLNTPTMAIFRFDLGLEIWKAVGAKKKSAHEKPEIVLKTVVFG